MIYRADATNFIANRVPKDQYKMIFMDPPDNIGLSYSFYDDKLPRHIYYAWLHHLITESITCAPIVWVSHYHKHMMPLLGSMCALKQKHRPTLNIRTFIWYYTFGQSRQKDFTNAYRPILRLTRADAEIQEVRVQSERQRIGDSRASSKGKFPDDVFNIPRVTGNSHERRSWHPTQHPEALLELIVKSSTRPGDRVLDLFGGTGTTLRVCKRLDRKCDLVEIDPEYVRKLHEEHPEQEVDESNIET